MVVVGIAGGTASGKTTMARALVRALGPRAVRVAHDRYYRDLPAAFRSDPNTYNFDHPDALETDRLISDLEALRVGRSVTLVDYDFATCSRKPSDAWTRVSPPDVLVVEGILVLAVPELLALFDHSVFVHTPADIRLARRLRRDIVDRGDTPLGVLDQYLATVRPMHEAFVEPSRVHANVEIEGTLPVELAVATIRARIAR